LPWPRLGKLGGGSLSERVTVKKCRDGTKGKPAKRPKHDCIEDDYSGNNSDANYTISSHRDAYCIFDTDLFFAAPRQVAGESTDISG
jgi:hypothetical protein